MSKYVKNLVSDHLRNRLDGVDDALLVNVIGLDANANNRLRGELEAKDIHLMAVKNSLAVRAVAGTPLGNMIQEMTGPVAICYGGEDIVTLAKEVTRLARDEQYEAFQARGGLMDGEVLSVKQVFEVSSWPNRQEQLSLLVGQILGPGATLAGQLVGPGGTVAGQIASKGEEKEEDAAEADGS